MDHFHVACLPPFIVLLLPWFGIAVDMCMFVFEADDLLLDYFFVMMSTICLNTSPAINPPLAGNPFLLIETMRLYWGLPAGK